MSRCARKPKWKLDQVGVGLNIAQNHSAHLVIACMYPTLMKSLKHLKMTFTNVT